MKKRIIQINGLGGIFMTLFIITCLIAGFIGFPGFVAMLIWNYFAQYLGTATISFFGGLLLWGIIALSFILLNKRHFIMSFAIPNTMTKDELSEIFKRAQQEDAEAIIKEIENKKEDWK